MNYLFPARSKPAAIFNNQPIYWIYWSQVCDILHVIGQTEVYAAKTKIFVIVIPKDELAGRALPM